MPPVGFKPTISVGVWLQTYALDRATTGTGFDQLVICNNLGKVVSLMQSATLC